MTEPFRTRVVESPVSPEIEPSAPSTHKSDELAGFEKKASDPLTEEEKTIDIWEGLNRKKIVSDYFKVEGIEHEFGIKMKTSEIDKYVRAELESLGYEKTVDNYKKVLADIETQIGSTNLEMSKRFDKITGYIRAINKLNSAKKLKESYLNSFMSD